LLAELLAERRGVVSACGKASSSVAYFVSQLRNIVGHFNERRYEPAADDIGQKANAYPKDEPKKPAAAATTAASP